LPKSLFLLVSAGISLALCRGQRSAGATTAVALLAAGNRMIGIFESMTHRELNSERQCRPEFGGWRETGT
jgi:hypothetical protein